MLLRFLRYATILGGLSFIVVQQCNKQHCYASNNRNRDVIMVFGILLTSECVLESTPVKTWFKSRSSTDVLVCLAMDSFWLED
jgi:hypothetical protein